MKKFWKRTALSLVGLAILAVIVYAFLPNPINVETGKAKRGAMLVTIEAEGETRARDRYTLASPVTGRVARIDLREGAPVQPGMAIAQVHPMTLDPLQREELERRIDAAEAMLRQATTAVELASATHEQATRERDRIRPVVVAGAVAQQDLDRAEDAVSAAAKTLESARFRAQGAASEAAVARAGRMAYTGNHAVVLRSPVRGRVLRVFEQSERTVQAGTPVIQIGDPGDLEIVIDVLSTEAVKIERGATVLLEGWGGEKPLHARVDYVEPAAFTKVSALGVEEQRVNVIARLTEPAARLGDGYRVDAKVVLWEGKNVLKVPVSALFRDKEGWSLFVIEDGRARLVKVRVGRMNAFEAEIIDGVKEGTEVVVHPSDDVADGIDIAVRK